MKKLKEGSDSEAAAAEAAAEAAVTAAAEAASKAAAEADRLFGDDVLK